MFKNEDTVEVFRRHPSKNLIRSTLVAIAVAHTLLELHSSTNLERHSSWRVCANLRIDSTNSFRASSGKLLLQLCVGVGSALSKQFLDQKQVLRKKCLKLSRHFFLANVQAMENTTVTFHLHLPKMQFEPSMINDAGWFWFGSKLWGVPRRMGLLLLLLADKADHQFCDESDLHIGLGFKVGHDVAPPGESKIQLKHQGCGQTATNALPRRQQFDESSFCRVRIQFPFGDLGEIVVSSNSTFLIVSLHDQLVRCLTPLRRPSGVSEKKPWLFQAAANNASNRRSATESPGKWCIFHKSLPRPVFPVRLSPVQTLQPTVTGPWKSALIASLPHGFWKMPLSFTNGCKHFNIRPFSTVGHMWSMLAEQLSVKPQR